MYRIPTIDMVATGKNIEKYRKAAGLSVKNEMGGKKMNKIYFTLTGTKYYHGNEFLKPGMKLKLEKEPDNAYDTEAIVVKMKGLGIIGYVANSPYTVIGDCMSAGRIYDRIGDTAKAKVVLVTPHGTICSLSRKSLIAQN